MNFLKKGPELKLSELRVPGFLQDLYYDLKDRHLLPVVAILLVAIVAVPIVVSQGDAEGPAIAGAGSEGTGGAEASISGASAERGELVAKAAPGLRDYRRRLDHKATKNPFEQQYTGEEGEGEGEGEGESETGSSSNEGSSSEGESTSESSSGDDGGAPATTEPSSGSGGGETGTAGKLTYYSYAIDVRIVSGGSGEDGEKSSTVRRNLPELSMLPSRKTPAIVYMGSTRDGKKAVMTISSEVQSIFGDAKCVLGSDTCQLMTMEAGLPVTLVYGGAERNFKIELLKIHLVETDKLNKAPLGEPKKDEKSGD